jgi:putative colanic acid biosynthesis glycosyltransferase WcaI
MKIDTETRTPSLTSLDASVNGNGGGGATVGRRIMVHDHCGHPFQLQLSRELARRGYDVLHLYCGSFLTGKGAVDDTDDVGLRIEPVMLSEEFSKYSPSRRLRQERQYGEKLAAFARQFRPHVVLSANTPLLAQKRLLRETRRLGARFVFWQQDLLGVGVRRVLERRLGRLGSTVGNRFVALERTMLLQSDAIVAISDGFLPALEEMHVPPEKIYVIENWAPIFELPVRPRENEWARRHDLLGKRILLYSGTLGLKHNPDVIVQLAQGLLRLTDVEVVVVSEGRGADWIKRRGDEEGLSNLRVLPFQPYTDLPNVLATGDVLLTLLEADAGAFSVPSKVLSYLCAQRPLLAAIPSDNLAAHVLRRSGGGVCVEPGDQEGLIDNAHRLLEDGNLRDEIGRRARRYAEETFDIRTIGDRFQPILDPQPLARAGNNEILDHKQREKA